MDDLSTVLKRAQKLMPNMPMQAWLLLAAINEEALRWLVTEAGKGRKATDANILPEQGTLSALLDWSHTPYPFEFWADLNEKTRRHR